jgi:glutathione synthase/RimK-type ligase-like ATP-grasp enzyme
MAPVVLPEDVAERCVDTTASLGLRLAGLDLLRDRDGGWWCLEVSTAPGFSWFEDRTGHPVAAAVASALAGGF